MSQIVVKIVKSLDGEYRVPDPSGRESRAYYTDDKADALGTAKHIWRHHLASVRFKFTRAKE